MMTGFSAGKTAQKRKM